jgi:hypothetical protein
VTPLQEAIAHGLPVDASNTPLPILPSRDGNLRLPHTA